jgi:hypothetical protein
VACAPDNPPATQWQFPATSGAAPAFMSFRMAREEVSKEFSISGFRPPAAAPTGDVFDGIKKQASLPVMPQQVSPSSKLAVTVLPWPRGSGRKLKALNSEGLNRALVSAEAIRAQQPGHGATVSRCAARPARAGDGLQRGGASSSPRWNKDGSAGLGAASFAVQPVEPDARVAELPQRHRRTIQEPAFHHEQWVRWFYGWRVWLKVLLNFLLK